MNSKKLFLESKNINLLRAINFGLKKMKYAQILKNNQMYFACSKKTLSYLKF